MGVSSAEYTLEKTMTLGDFFAFIVPKIGCFSTNVFVKPNEQNRAYSSYAMARKRRMKSNVIIPPYLITTDTSILFDGGVRCVYYAVILVEQV